MGGNASDVLGLSKLMIDTTTTMSSTPLLQACVHHGTLQDPSVMTPCVLHLWR